MSNTHWKRDVVEDAQKVMNENKALENKNLISSMANEIIALRAEIERLEDVVYRIKIDRFKEGTQGNVKSVTVTFDMNGLIDGVHGERYGDS
jgi:hypothetical protein